MQILLKTLTGRTLLLNLEPTNTVADIKRMVFTELTEFQGMPMSSFRILSAGKALSDDSQSIGELELQKTNCIHLVINGAKAADMRTDSDKSNDTALFADASSQVVWSLVYLDKEDTEQNKPFDRETFTINTSEKLSDVIEAYKHRKATSGPGRVPYIAATVMPQDWNVDVIVTGGDKSSGGLSTTIMGSSDKGFNRPVLALYSVSADESSFNRIQNPLYRTEGLSTSSAMAFEQAFSSTNSSALSSAPPALSMGAGSGSSASSSVAPVVSVVTAGSERLPYVSRHIASNLSELIGDFSDERVSYTELAEGTSLAIRVLVDRYNAGPLSDGQAMKFAQGLPSKLAREICSAIAIGVEHDSAPRIAEISRGAVFTSAKAYLEWLQAFSFHQLLDYLDITHLVRVPIEPAATAGAGTSVGAGAPASVASVKAETLLSPVASAPPVFVESVVALNPFAPSAPPVDMTVHALAQRAAAPTALVVLDVEGTIRDSGWDEEAEVSMTTYQKIAPALTSLKTLGCEIVLATGLKKRDETRGDQMSLEDLEAQLEAEGIRGYISRLQPKASSGSAHGEDKAQKIQAYLTELQAEGREVAPQNVYSFDDLPSDNMTAHAIRALGVNFHSVNNLACDDSGNFPNSLATLLTQLVHSLSPVVSSSAALAGAGTSARATATVVPPPFYSGAASGVVTAGASDGPFTHEQALKVAFVQAFMDGYRSDAKGHRFFGSLGRNMDFLKLLDKMPEELKFENIKSHFAEGQDSKNPKRTAVVVQSLLAQDRFTGLISDFVPSHK